MEYVSVMNQLLVLGLILGIAIVVLSFSFAILNMTRRSEDPFDTREWNRDFRRHGYAMIGMMLGGLLFLVSAAALGVDFINDLIDRVLDDT